MGAIVYNSRNIIPAPFVDIKKDYIVSGDGKRIGSTFIFTLKGKLVPYKGSPCVSVGDGAIPTVSFATSYSSGFDSLGFWTVSGYPPDEVVSSDTRLTAILKKQERLRRLFATDGATFEIIGYDGFGPLTCNPRVKDINFSDALWFEECDYTITLEADVVYINGMTAPGYEDQDNFGGYYIRSGEENWQVDSADGTEIDTYKVTHTVSASGKRFYNQSGTLVAEAWQNARDWVLSRLGSDSSIISMDDVVELNIGSSATQFKSYNHVRSQNVNETDGSFSVTESWVLSRSAATEDYTIETRTSAETGLTTVGISGTITGLDSRTLPQDLNNYTNSNKYTNANTYFNTVSSQFITRAQSYSGVTLNVSALSTTVGRNPVTGVISYSYEYDNRPSNFITDSLSESISINDENSSGNVDLFAVTVVLGRTLGPVLQDLGTTKERRRTLNIEIVMNVSSASFSTIAGALAAKPNVDSVVTECVPSISASGQRFIESDTDNWNFKTGRYSRTVSWVYEP